MLYLVKLNKFHRHQKVILIQYNYEQGQGIAIILHRPSNIRVKALKIRTIKLMYSLPRRWLNCHHSLSELQPGARKCCLEKMGLKSWGQGSLTKIPGARNGITDFAMRASSSTTPRITSSRVFVSMEDVEAYFLYLSLDRCLLISHCSTRNPYRFGHVLPPTIFTFPLWCS